MKSFTPLILSVLTIIYASSLSSGDSGIDENPPVKICILSKHIRLLREAKLDQIKITLPDNTVISDENNNEQHCRNIVFSFSDNIFRASIDSIEQMSAFQYRILGSKSETVCTVKLGNEVRQYPATFLIIYNSKGPEFYTWERVNQYAVDSACAEYESSFWKEHEAVLALAHVIRARYYYAKKTPQHKDFDFCDLTHCQVYRGRINNGLTFNGDWIIDHDKLKNNLFFHSRCGGHTFGAEVFGNENMLNTLNQGVRDWIYHKGIQLCSAADSAWECSISADEIIQLLADKPEVNDLPDNNSPDQKIEYDKNANRFFIQDTNKSIIDSFAPETIRIKINRVKGWNFIKSNNYTVAEESNSNKKIFRFKGQGLGHGAGLCQHGALRLSRMGYSRYEILEHYFRDIKLINHKGTGSLPPYLSYCTFDMLDGSIRKIGSENFLNRITPPGSVFKLLVSLYLAKERPDIFNEYTYTCGGTDNDTAMPGRCWNQKGHGSINIRDALPDSCNLYFASLYNKISQKHFKIFFEEFCRCLGIVQDLPQISNDSEWAKLLAGLDYRISFTINDYIKIIQFLKPDSSYEKNSFLETILPAQRNTIFQSLKQTFIKGTASGSVKPFGSVNNYSDIDRQLKKADLSRLENDLWGKTATTIDGTNKPVSYGLFIGGLDNTGILVLLRKGNGHLAAKWAQVLLSYNGK